MKQQNVVVTFGGRAYDATIGLAAARYREFGATQFWCYDEPWLTQSPAAREFYTSNKWAWDHPGHKGHKYGFGWYIWKPFVIRHAMRFLKPGDVLLWLDADTYPIADFSMLFDACRKEGGIFAFEATGCTNRQWVKRDIWEAMMTCDPRSPLIDTQHATARFILFECGRPSAHAFLDYWEDMCSVPGLATRDPSQEPEFSGFEENRGDQSIFSLLCLKYGLPLHREADAFGESSQKDRELYGQLFEQKYCSGNRSDLSGSKYRSGPE